jgi:hypothetical protein
MGRARAVIRPDVPERLGSNRRALSCNRVVTLLSHEAFGDFYQRQVRQTSPQKELRLTYFDS